MEIIWLTSIFFAPVFRKYAGICQDFHTYPFPVVSSLGGFAFISSSFLIYLQFVP